jgi:hypothetical protein
VKSHRSLFIKMALIVLLLPVIVSAQSGRNAKERVNNETQIAVDKHQLARDQREVQEFERLLRELDTLRESRAGESYLRINTKLRAAMARELAQARAKTGQAGREVNQSRREKHAERMEAAATDLPRDYRQLADDRRDLRDDRRDRQAAAVLARRMDSIISLATSLQPAVTEGNSDAIAENRRLMGEFLEVLQADLAATRSELGEDRRERREDGRERRTDGKK